MMAFGSRTRFPLAGGSKRQGCVSHSTPEAEIIAADYALRIHAIPIISLWKTLVQQDPRIVFHDDNQGMIAIIRSGQNPTMRPLGHMVLVFNGCMKSFKMTLSTWYMKSRRRCVLTFIPKLSRIT